MTDYDHSDALRFRSEADRWQKRALAAEAELAVLSDRIAELETQLASVPWEALRHVYDTAQEWYSEHLNTPTEIDDAIVREWLFTCATPEADND